MYTTTVFAKTDNCDIPSGLLEHQNWGIKQIDILSKLPIYTIKSLWFYWIHFTITKYVTIFAAGFLKTK